MIKPVLISLSLLLSVPAAFAEDFACQEVVKKEVGLVGLGEATPKVVELGSNFWNELQSRKSAIDHLYANSHDFAITRHCGGEPYCMMAQYAVAEYGEEAVYAHIYLGHPLPEKKLEGAENLDADLIKARKEFNEFTKKAEGFTNTLGQLDDTPVDKIVSYNGKGKQVNVYFSKGRMVALESSEDSKNYEVLAWMNDHACSIKRIRQQRPLRTFTAHLCANREKAKAILMGRNSLKNAMRDKYFTQCSVRGGGVDRGVCKCRDSRVINPMAKGADQRCNKSDVPLDSAIHVQVSTIGLDIAAGAPLYKFDQSQLEKLKTDIYDMCDRYPFMSMDTQGAKGSGERKTTR